VLKAALGSARTTPERSVPLAALFQRRRRRTVLWPPIFQGMGVKFKLITRRATQSARARMVLQADQMVPRFYLQRMAALRKS
jgi:hypothetical protein